MNIAKQTENNKLTILTTGININSQHIQQTRDIIQSKTILGYIFVTAVVYSVQSMLGFLYDWCECLFVSELNNEYSTIQIF